MDAFIAALRQALSKHGGPGNIAVGHAIGMFQVFKDDPVSQLSYMQGWINGLWCGRFIDAKTSDTLLAVLESGYRRPL